MPFNALLFRFIDPQFSAAEDIISGEGSHWASGRWNLKGAMRVAYTATEPETALAECLAHARYYNLPLKHCPAARLGEFGVKRYSRFRSAVCHSAARFAH
jgi:RES domain-containing protein